MVFILLHWMSYSAFILFRWIPTADLLQKRQKIADTPVTSDLAVLDAHDIDRLEVNLAVRWSALPAHLRRYQPFNQQSPK